LLRSCESREREREREKNPQRIAANGSIGYVSSVAAQSTSCFFYPSMYFTCSRIVMSEEDLPGRKRCGEISEEKVRGEIR
jgi:hypothetical protein